MGWRVWLVRATAAPSPGLRPPSPIGRGVCRTPRTGKEAPISTREEFHDPDKNLGGVSAAHAGSGDGAGNAGLRPHRPTGGARRGAGLRLRVGGGQHPCPAPPGAADHAGRGGFPHQPCEARDGRAAPGLTPPRGARQRAGQPRPRVQRPADPWHRYRRQQQQHRKGVHRLRRGLPPPHRASSRRGSRSCGGCGRSPK